MDECSDAGDFQCRQNDEQVTSTRGERSTMDQNCLRDSGETLDKASAHHFGAMEEGAGAPLPTTEKDESVFEMPIFALCCPCGPQCKTFKSETSDPDLPHGAASPSQECVENASENIRQDTSKSDLIARCSIEQPHSNHENNRMECELSGHELQKAALDYSGCEGCVKHDFISNRGKRSGDDTEEGNVLMEKDCSSPQDSLEDLKLDELDDDSIFHIASVMEARSVKHCLGLACERFQSMFDNETYWKTRISMKWQKRYPAITAPEDFSWENACIEGEECMRLYRNPETETAHFMYSYNVYGDVDSVHLMQNAKLLIAGGRDRNLNVIDLSKYDPDCGVPSMAEMKDMLVANNATIHKSWVWSLTSIGNHLMTGSWDTRIRVFDMNTDIHDFTAYKCKSAVLSIYAEENDLVASCYDKKVYFFDRRRTTIENTHTYHKKPVLAVTGNKDFIISASEDKTICIYDRRAGKLFSTLKLDSYPLCLSFGDNQLWCGDKLGRTHLYDTTMGMFSHVGTYDVGHKEKLTDIVYTPGSLFTCSGDKTLKVLTPTRYPEEIRTFHVHKKELAAIDYSCGVLASGGGDEGIGVWVPKNWQRDYPLRYQQK